MREQTKLDIAEAGAFAMIPIMITAMLLVEAFMMPYLLCSLDFVTAAVLASILASISMGICYFVIKQLLHLAKNILWRS